MLTHIMGRLWRLLAWARHQARITRLKQLDIQIAALDHHIACDLSQRIELRSQRIALAALLPPDISLPARSTAHTGALAGMDVQEIDA